MSFSNPKFYYFFLGSLCLIFFSPTFFNYFQTSWDDQWQLINNPYVVNLSFRSFLYHISNFYHGQYSPVNTLYYYLIYVVFGMSAAAYHTGSLLLHIANTLLVFNFFQKIIKVVRPLNKTAHVLYFSGFASLVFAIHPLQVESIAWISASKILLCTLFMLLGCIAYIKYIMNGKWHHLVLTAVFYALAFGSKEQGILLVLILPLLDWVFGRYKGLNKSNYPTYKKILLEKIPFVIIAFGMWYFSTANNLGGFIGENVYPLWQRLFFGGHSLIQYIFRSIAPIKLYYLYAYPMDLGEPLPVSFYIYPALVLMLSYFVHKQVKLKSQIVVFGIAFFLINLVLVLHIVPIPRYMITADRYMYLSMAGFGLVSSWFIYQLYIKYKQHRKLLVIGCSIWFLFLGGQSFYHTTLWKNSETIKKKAQEEFYRRNPANEPPVNFQDP